MPRDPSGRPTLRSRISTFNFKPYLPGSGDGGQISFPAHITDFSINSNPSWNEEFEMGRADPVMMYGSYNKNMSVSFIVVTLNKVDAEENYTELSRLGMLTYPIHQSGRGYNAPHVLFNIGEFIGGIGVITTLDYRWTGETPWLGDPPRPLLTEVSLAIKILTDPQGKRPSYKNDVKTYMGYR